ncbi:MAG: lipocalin family protein [Prevotella sp.]|nr:hypothetical protein [Prevotella sp.]MCR5152271.1 lipocalin family protein [Prevotella sp.]
MKKILPLLIVAFIAVCGCDDKKGKNVVTINTTPETETDSTVYGKCGEQSAASSIELITDDGVSHQYYKDDSTDEDPVKGGIEAGDRLALIIKAGESGDTIATSVINLTTLYGKWSSMDKTFEIRPDGSLIYAIQHESNPNAKWRVFNGKLILNADTFKIQELGIDTLYLEGNNGKVAFKRQ